MYTVDDQKNDVYEDENYETSRWDNNKGLIFKIIIIILCIVVLIWLVKALKNNKSDNGEVYAANVEKVRLAAENYFFINNNKEKTSVVTLGQLKSNGLVGTITDANDKTCSDNNSKVNLKKDVDAYEMTVRLSCGNNGKDKKFYYHTNTLACLNCDGKTNMNGNTVVIVDEPEEQEIIVDNNDNYYSCIEWSDWTKDKVYDSSLVERTKTLVQGVKYGKKTAYGEWSEYTTTPIESSDTVEVETKTETESVWSENRTGTDIDTNNANIRVVDSETYYETINGCNGFVDNNVCYSNTLTTGNLTMKEYTSGDYKVTNDRCERVMTLLNSEGKYVLTYVNCQYYKKISNSTTYSRAYTVYTYQELETRDVVYYRSRSINTVDEADSYTTLKYEETDLPEGYVKVAGSEEIYYSYKLNSCEK